MYFEDGGLLKQELRLSQMVRPLSYGNCGIPEVRILWSNGMRDDSESPRSLWNRMCNSTAEEAHNYPALDTVVTTVTVLDR